MVKETFNVGSQEGEDFSKYSHTKCVFAQSLVAVVLGMLNVNLGFMFAIPAIAIGGLIEEKELFHINSYEASWFGSIPFISLSVVSFLAGFIQDLIGRKGTVLLAHAPVLLGWILLYYTNSITVLYSSAAVMGLGLALAQSPVLIYSGEVFQPKFRGTLSSLQGIFFNMGFIGTCLLGAIYRWRTAVLVCTFWPILTFLMILVIPESPVWLAQKRKLKKAKACLCWLRGWTEEKHIQNEWDDIMQNINNKKHNQDIQLQSPEENPLQKNESDLKTSITTDKKSKSSNSFKTFFSPAVQRPMLLLMAYFFGAFCICLIPVKPVIVSVLQEMEISVDPYWFMVFTAVVQLIGAISFSIVLKRFGKRLITFFGFISAILTCFGLSLYVQLNYHITWIPLTLFSINSFISTFGVTTIPWILVTEVFPLEFRGVGAGVATALSNISTFCTTKTFINIKLLLGLSGVFTLYGVIGIFTLIFLYFKLPETEGRTIHDIESSFKSKKKSKLNLEGFKIEQS